jgi:nitroreductase
MNFMELARSRRSMGLSRLADKPVDRALVEQLLEAANWAPSNEDTEPWRFTVFMGEGREKLAELFLSAQREDDPEADPRGPAKRAYAAPVWIAIGVEPVIQEDGTFVTSMDEEIMAVACAVQNLHLMAQSLGLAGMWHSKGTSVHPAVTRGLGWESPSQLLGFFMLGWPATDWLTSKRLPIGNKTTWYD